MRQLISHAPIHVGAGDATRQMKEGGRNGDEVEDGR